MSCIDYYEKALRQAERYEQTFINYCNMKGIRINEGHAAAVGLMSAFSVITDDALQVEACLHLEPGVGELYKDFFQSMVQDANPPEEEQPVPNVDAIAELVLSKVLEKLGVDKATAVGRDGE